MVKFDNWSLRSSERSCDSKLREVYPSRVFSLAEIHKHNIFRNYVALLIATGRFALFFLLYIKRYVLSLQID